MDTPDSSRQLRAAAEAKLLQSDSLCITKAAEADLHKLLHELQVHQIELEMQNEELLQTQAALELSRDRYMDLYEYAPVGYLTLDRNGEITQVNMPAAVMLAKDRHRLIGCNLALLLAEHDQDRWYLFFQSARKDKSGSERSAVFSTAGQVVKILDVQLNGVRVNSFNELPMLRVTLIDVTQLKQAERALRIAATAFESNEGFVITDENNLVLQVNNAYTRITGYSSAELNGKPPDILTSTLQNPDFYSELWTSVQNTGRWEGEISYRRKDGNIAFDLLTITVIKNEDGIVTNHIIALSDSTIQKKTLKKLRSIAAELKSANIQIDEERSKLAQRVEELTAQLQLANHAKDNFLATMSHEIRTPLNGMLGMMELLALSGLNPEQTHTLHIAQLSGNNLLRIVNDILDWSKIEAGKLTISPISASIAELINVTTSDYQHLAHSKKLHFEHRIDSNLSALHMFDVMRISQILNNLTSNAIKFTERGGISIVVDLLSSHDGVETVRFSIKDTGCGIDQEQQRRLFHQYEQATSETARMYGGTGLGLAISLRLAELMNGTLKIESQIGLGSTFSLTIDLPVASPPKTSAIPHHQVDVSSEYNLDVTPIDTEGKVVTVLIVDDHPINRMLLKKQILMLGLQVEMANDGAQALALFKARHFDMVITDCHMPVMNGYELCMEIRAIEQATGKPPTPIIAWTANVLTEVAERCRTAKIDGLLIKPTELPALKAKLYKWLRKTEVLH